MVPSLARMKTAIPLLALAAVSLNAPAARAQDAAAPAIALDRQGLTASQEAQYQAGFRAYQQRRYPDAIQIYMNLARENHCCGVLGMVVASLASTAPTPERAEAAAREADAAPDDILKQFVAGVLAHYAAHVNGRDQEEKSRLYTQAIRYLERTRSTLTEEPRLYIYLAVSNFRLGRQREAEAFIERAVQLAAHDPDAYDCRAEIFQRVNVRRSIEDIDTYLRMNAENEARGAVGDPGKTERVRLMRAHLLAVAEGRAQPQELFDPVAEQRRALEAAETRRDAPPSPGAAQPAPGAAAQPSPYTGPTLRNDPGPRGGGPEPGPTSPRARFGYVIGAAALAAASWALGRYQSQRASGGGAGGAEGGADTKPGDQDGR